MSNSSTRRVVVTGVGLVSPLGNSQESLWSAISSGQSGIQPIQHLPVDHLPTSFGGEARDFSGHIDDFGPLDKKLKRSIKKGLNVMCREIAMGVAAAQFALGNAQLALGDYDPDRSGTVYGSDYIMTLPEEFAAGVHECLDANGHFDFSQWGQRGMPEVAPLWLLKYLPNMPASHIAIYNDLRGPSNSITLREASANLAVGEAYWTIVRDAADTMIAGATGTRIHPLRTIHVVLQEQIANGGVEPAAACRPFDAQRTGMVLAEGAGAIVLEELESARKRGAPILAEVVGHGSSTVLDRRGVAKTDAAVENALQRAMDSAGLTCDQIGHVNAHGLATQHSDVAEAQAINRVFADSPEVPVVALKSYSGNLGAGSGMIELIASVLSLQHGTLFPVLNYEHPDPECRLAVVRSNDVKPGDSFVSANFTPHGQASAVALRRVD